LGTNAKHGRPSIAASLSQQYRKEQSFQSSTPGLGLAPDRFRHIYKAPMTRGDGRFATYREE
jgi:hypothetical protein